MQRFLPPHLMLVIVVLIAVLSVVLPEPAFPALLRFLGIPVLLAGLFLNLRHARLFHTLGTNIRTFNDPDQLVRTGAFAWTRNPMYVGFTAIALGLAMLSGPIAALIGPVVFFVAADRWYIPFEEKRMLATFGNEYITYQHEVPRWIGLRR